MEKDTAKQKFIDADNFYKAGNAEDALKVLKELDAAFPNSRHIMFPMARCLAKLKYLQASLDLCDEIYEKFQYEKAIELKDRISNLNTPNINFDDLEIEYESIHESEQNLESDL